MNEIPVIKCTKHHIPLIPSDCKQCHGDGMLEDDKDEFGGNSGIVPCWACGGSGQGWPECELCLLDEDES